MPKTILVTGGAGFIGSAVVRELIHNSEHTVINLDKLTYAGNLDSLASVADHLRHHFVRADITDAKHMAGTAAPLHRCGVIFGQNGFGLGSAIARSAHVWLLIRHNALKVFRECSSLTERAYANDWGYEFKLVCPASRNKEIRVCFDKLFNF